MALIPWRPWLWRNEEDLDNFFGGKLPEMRAADFMPPVDIYEKGNNMVVETQIPGIDPEKVEVSVEDNALILKGKSEKKSEVEEKNYYRKEMHFGSFYRAIPLPVNVVGDKADANYEDGILKVSIPKAALTKGKKVKIIKVKKVKK